MTIGLEKCLRNYLNLLLPPLHIVIPVVLHLSWSMLGGGVSNLNRMLYDRIGVENFQNPSIDQKYIKFVGVEIIIKSWSLTQRTVSKKIAYMAIKEGRAMMDQGKHSI